MKLHPCIFSIKNIPPLDDCPLSLGSLESDITDAIDEFSEPDERDNSLAISSNVLGVVNFSFKKILIVGKIFRMMTSLDVWKWLLLND